jgi:hypothetical protein
MINKFYGFAALTILFAGLTLLTLATLFKDLLIFNFTMVGTDSLVLILLFVITIVNFSFCSFYYRKEKVGG